MKDNKNRLSYKKSGLGYSQNKKKSISLPKITADRLLRKMPERLEFPRRDDSSLLAGFGKKHYLIHNQTSQQKMFNPQVQTKLKIFRQQHRRINSETSLKQNVPTIRQQNKTIKYTNNEKQQKAHRIIQKKLQPQQRQNSQPSSTNINAEYKNSNLNKIVSQLDYKYSPISPNRQIGILSSHIKTEQQSINNYHSLNSPSKLHTIREEIGAYQVGATSVKYRNPTYLSTGYLS